MKRKGNWLGLIWAVGGLALVGGTGYGLWAFQEARAQKEKEEIPANLIAKAARRNIETRLLLTGEVAPAFSVEVKSEINGRVEVIHVRTGETVKRGDPLLTIDDTDLLTEKSAAQTEIEGAQLEVDKRRGNFERAKALFEEKLISKEVFANLEADLRISENNLVKSEARLQSVEDRLSKTRIVAPADGSVLNINVNEGQVVAGANNVNSGVILMNFADLSRLTIQTHVNQMDLSKVKVGDNLQIRMPPPDEDSITAKIEFIAPIATVRNNIKGFAVEAIISHPDERLRPGMSVSLTLPLGSASGAVAVPVSAVFREDDGHRYVYVRRGGTTERRSVVVGISNFSHAEILEGLEEGEEILLAPPRNLTEQS
jgi:RND family efflux transporter MFP subunit